MRIVVNDIAASFGGALTILRQFYEFISENDKENEWIFLLSDSFLNETDNIKVILLPQIKKSHIRKILFDCFTGRKFINDLKPDLVLSLQNIITFGVKAPQAVYVHQSIPFQDEKKFSFFKRNEFGVAKVQYIIGAFIKYSTQKADLVFVQTEWMKNCVSKKSGIPKSKIIKVFPKSQQIPSDSSKFNCKKFFYPTSSETYKNISTIVEACDLLNINEIHDFTVYLTLPQEINVHNNIQCVGRLNTDEIKTYYQTCTLLFPSYIETVGLPLLEAGSCGTMIVSSDTPFAHECLDGYDNALFFKALDSNELYENMKNIIIGNICPHVISDFKHNNCDGEWDILYKKMMQLHH